jgi:ATP-dependent RNA helicase DeaD
LKQGAQIVIGTPGRVMDHMRRGTIRLEKSRWSSSTKADVMLNMGFRDDIETILKDAPKERQTVFFSATMPRPIRDLIEKYSRESAEREDRAEGDDRPDRRAGLLRSGPPLQNGFAHAAH